jgi:hypothetical protein
MENELTQMLKNISNVGNINKEEEVSLNSLLINKKDTVSNILKIYTNLLQEFIIKNKFYIEEENKIQVFSYTDIIHTYLTITNGMLNIHHKFENDDRENRYINLRLDGIVLTREEKFDIIDGVNTILEKVMLSSEKYDIK